ncbi:hypothetical protein [Frondihabitans sp. PAMC 28766]|uniref:hypothetical protein n=1 Tax=Frondihabitans sp. PAMC 28766 TaxID=1795630 RepID=UPI0012FF7041|nr:hypothetical protein [Frondihabitans sp. PAMC 28766]
MVEKEVVSVSGAVSNEEREDGAEDDEKNASADFHLGVPGLRLNGCHLCSSVAPARLPL